MTPGPQVRRSIPLAALVLAGVALIVVLTLAPAPTAAQPTGTTSTVPTEPEPTTTPAPSSADPSPTVDSTQASSVPSSTSPATSAAPATSTAASNPTSTTASAANASTSSETTVDARPAVLASDGAIQVLRVDEVDDGRVTLEIAIPPSIGDLAPVADNFGVLAGGRLLDFEVAPLTTGVDVVIVIDTSGSMRGDALTAAKEAAARFVRSLPAEATVGVVSFGQEVTVHRSPGLDRDGPVADIAGLASAGETALWDGLVAASAVAGGSGTARPYVVLLSDGDDTVSTATRPDAVDALRGAGISLYAIAIESPDADGAALDEIVSVVGGSHVVTTGSGELSALYQEISDRLDSRYELSFQPGDGGRNDIAISVAAGNAIATARTGLDRESIGDDASSPSDPSGAPASDPAGPASDDAAGGTPEGSGAGPGGEVALGSVVVEPPVGLFGLPLMYPVGLGAAFVAMLIVGYLLAGQTSKVSLGSAAGADRVADLNTRMTGVVDQWLARNDKDGRVELALDTAGINLKAGEFVLVGTVVVASIGLVVGSATAPAAGILTGAVAAVLVVLVVSAKISRRRAAFAEQLSGTLTIMTGALRAGYGLPQAIELVSRESSSPTSDQFRRIVFESRVGRDTTESMMGVAKRMESRDFEWIARAVAINRELGGDLTELLENVAETIRDRRRVARMVRSLTAEGRMSGWVLTALPVALFAFMTWRSPENTRLLLEDGLGRMMLAGAVGGMVVGFIWIRRLVDVKY